MRALRERGIRSRVTLGAVSIVALALAIGAIGVVIAFRQTLTDNVRSDAFARARAIAEGPAGGAAFEDAGGDDGFAQLLGPDGEVLVFTLNVTDEPPLAELVPGESREVSVPFDDDPFMVVALATGDSQTILVGRSLDGVTESVAALIALLVVGVPLVCALIAWVIWVMVGRALAPVEAIRSEVDTISTGDLHRRVPVPGSGDEVARLAATMNGMLERLDEGLARERRFVSDASHELRSPVATIRQYVEFALAHPDQVSVQELATTVLAEDLRLQGLVEDLLLLARMDERMVDAPRTPVDLDDIVLAEVERVRNGGKVAVEARGVSGGRVVGDHRQLERLVVNLVDNAVKYARARVRVGLGAAGDSVLLSVEDDGPGVSDDDRDRVFERFVRLDEARDRTSGGAGLGLAIVREVASAHGGRALVTTSELGGARFEVHLPQAA